MKNSASSLMWVVLLTAMVVSFPGIVEGQTVIAKSGPTSVRVRSAGKDIDIAFHTARVERNSDAFPSIESDTKAVTLVQKLEISIGGKSIFVPRSVFADLLDPRKASIQFEKGDFVLKIAGADGAESYFVNVYFDMAKVKRRMLYSALTPSIVAEDTHYRLTVLKDE